jgi:ATP-dependent protease ClpP protease subunit
MNRAVLFTTVAAGAALVGASVLARRTAAAMLLAPGVIPIVTPFIDINVAERVLATMARLPDQPITLVLHTLGGCVTACVMIANALREFSDATAVIPYMAVSGGTLIALNATRIEMGRHASLSAVDPVTMGHRVKHLAEGKDRSLAGLAREYEAAMRTYLRDTLGAHLAKDRLDAAMATFMGEHAPHEWPIRSAEAQALGIPITPIAPKWTALVDTLRGRA